MANFPPEWVANFSAESVANLTPESTATMVRNTHCRDPTHNALKKIRAKATLWAMYTRVLQTTKRMSPKGPEAVCCTTVVRRKLQAP